MDYSDRVNAKKGGGGVADSQETNVHTKRRLKELLTSQVLDLDNDPYVFRNHLGLLECKLCLTTHVSESSYISHLGGKKHGLNLEKRRTLDEKYNRKLNRFNNNTTNNHQNNFVTINSINKRSWNKIGKPYFKITKIRDPENLQLGLLINLKYPSITVNEPFFRFMSYYELSTQNQKTARTFIKIHKDEDEEPSEAEDGDPNAWQYIVFSAEPYENIAIAIPNTRMIDKPSELEEMSKNYWWFWDEDVKDFFLQFMFK